MQASTPAGSASRDVASLDGAGAGTREGVAITALRVATLAAAALLSVITLVWDGSFPAPARPEAINQVLAEGRGWSLVTLALVVPLGALAGWHARRGSTRARLAQAGVAAYLFYAYLELAVSPPFTPLYLGYIAVFAGAFAALAYDVATIDRRAVAARFGGRGPRRAVAVFGLTFAAGLALAWSPGIVGDLAAGRFGWPSGSAAVGHVVHALDLGFYVPLGLATAVLLSLRRPAGYLLGAIALTIGVCMGSALVAMVVAALTAAGESALGALPFAVIPVVAATLGVFYLRAIEDGA